MDRNVHSRRVATVLVGIAIDGEVEEVGSNAAVVEQGVSLAGRTVPTNLGALLLALNQE